MIATYMDTCVSCGTQVVCFMPDVPPGTQWFARPTRCDDCLAKERANLPKYPGLQEATFHEMHEFADRLLRQLGIIREPLGIRNFDLVAAVAAVYNEMVREKVGPT